MARSIYAKVVGGDMNVNDLQAMLATLPKSACLRLPGRTPRVSMLTRKMPRVSSLVRAVAEALSDSGSTHHVRPPRKGEDVDQYPLVDVELATGTGQLRMSPGGVLVGPADCCIILSTGLMILDGWKVYWGLDEGYLYKGERYLTITMAPNGLPMLDTILTLEVIQEMEAQNSFAATILSTLNLPTAAAAVVSEVIPNPKPKDSLHKAVALGRALRLQVDPSEVLLSQQEWDNMCMFTQASLRAMAPEEMMLGLYQSMEDSLGPLESMGEDIQIQVSAMMLEMEACLVEVRRSTLPQVKAVRVPEVKPGDDTPEPPRVNRFTGPKAGTPLLAAGGRRAAAPPIPEPAAPAPAVPIPPVPPVLPVPDPSGGFAPVVAPAGASAADVAQIARLNAEAAEANLEKLRVRAQEAAKLLAAMTKGTKIPKPGTPIGPNVRGTVPRAAVGPETRALTVDMDESGTWEPGQTDKERARRAVQREKSQARSQSFSAAIGGGGIRTQSERPRAREERGPVSPGSKGKGKAPPHMDFSLPVPHGDFSFLNQFASMDLDDKGKGKGKGRGNESRGGASMRGTSRRITVELPARLPREETDDYLLRLLPHERNEYVRRVNEASSSASRRTWQPHREIPSTRGASASIR